MAWIEEAVLRPDRTAWLTFRLAALGLTDATPACRISAKPAGGGDGPEVVMGRVRKELPEETGRLVAVLRTVALSVIVGSVLLGLGVSWGQDREWLRHDTTRTGTTGTTGTGGGAGGPGVGGGGHLRGPRRRAACSRTGCRPS
ncbi:hypothetical protein [Kitasatospora sp. KL5]|uniref:hypothetical protein n=1 Tax=Kitasatospora sp. KL5 TaxID=3425125 RepID=UPI003D6E55A3